MGFLETMRGQRIYIDAAPLIYYMEGNPSYNEPLDAFFSLLDQGNFQAITSTLTLAEVLVKPYRGKQWALADKYESIFEGMAELTMFPVESNVGRLAAKLRASHSLLTPDAIHWATAMIHEARFFLTNDRDFRKLDQTNPRFPHLVFIDELL